MHRRRRCRLLLYVAVAALSSWLAYEALCLRAAYLSLLAQAGWLRIPTAVAALSDTAEPVRAVCVSYFAHVGADAIPALVQALHDNDARTRRGAAQSLGAIAEMHEELRPMLQQEALPGLIGALADTDSEVRAWAARAVWYVIHDANQVVPTLVGLLDDPNREACYAASVVLGDMGPSAKLAIPRLLQMRNGPDELRRVWADSALRKIQPQRAGK